MAQYIDKSLLKEWIKSQIDSLERNSGCSGIFGESQMAVYDKLLSFINTLEVKEVDLEKEFFDWYHKESTNDYNASTLYERYSTISKKLAKHFFELGLKAKGEDL